MALFNHYIYCFFGFPKVNVERADCSMQYSRFVNLFKKPVVDKQHNTLITVENSTNFIH